MGPRIVMLSHTADLAGWPSGTSWVSAAKAAVADAGCAVSEMSHFAASNNSPADVSAAAVRAADVYVGIVGWKYGTRVPERSDMSYTEYEFELAGKSGKPRLIFLLSREAGRRGHGLVDARDSGRQRIFRERLRSGSGLHVKEVSTPDSLRAELGRALRELESAPVLPPSVSAGTEIARPIEHAAVLDMLCDREMPDRIVGLWGPGGFGKSTLARLIENDARVQREFPDGVLRLDVGSDLGELTTKLNDATCLLTGERPNLVDAGRAAEALRRQLRHRRVLVIADDVWHREQVEAVTTASARLLITRDRSLLPDTAAVVEVGPLDAESAVALLTAGVRHCSPQLIAETLAVTGSCAFALALVNGDMRDEKKGPDVALARFLRAHRAGDPSLVDGEEYTQFIDTTIKSLTPEDRVRFAELAVLPADAVVNPEVIEAFWEETGGWTEYRGRRLLNRLVSRCLVVRDGVGDVSLHDIVHAYLRAHTPAVEEIRLHRALLDAHRPRNGWWDLPRPHYLWSRAVQHLVAGGLQRELDDLVCHPAWISARLEDGGPEAVRADASHGSTTLARQLVVAVRQNAHLLGPLSPAGSVVATLASRLPSIAAALTRGLAARLGEPHLELAAPAPDLPHPALDRVLQYDAPVSFLVPVPARQNLVTAAWSGDTGRRGIVLWDRVEGRRRHEIVDFSPPITSVAGDPDGRWIAVADAGSLRIWSTIDGRLLGEHPGGAHTLTAVGHRLMATDPRNVRIVDPMLGRLDLTLQDGDACRLDDAVADPAGEWLGLHSAKAVHIVDLARREQITTLSWPIQHDWRSSGGRRRMAVAPDGSWLAAARGDRALIWRRAHNDWSVIRQRSVQRLAGDPGGRWIALLDGFGRVAVWDVAEGTERWECSVGSGGDDDHVLVDPEGHWLALGGRRGICVLAAADGRLLCDHDEPVAGMVCDPEGRQLATSRHSSHFVDVWDLRTGQLRTSLPHGGWVTKLAAGGDWFASGDDHETVRVWNWPSDDDAPVEQHPVQTEGVNALACDADLQCIATVDGGGSLRIWDARSGALRHGPHPAYRRAVAVASDGTWVATVTNGTLEIRDVASGAIRHAIDGVYDERVHALALPDAVAAYTGSNTLQVWDAGTAAPLFDIPLWNWISEVFVADPRGRWLAVAQRGPDPESASLQIRSLPDGSPIATIQGWVGSPIADGQGRWILGILDRGRIELWDADSGRHVQTLTGGNAWVRHLAMDSDGRWVASRHDDYMIDLWDLDRGRHVRTLGGHPGGVTAFAASPRGGLLASAGKDNVIRIWRPWTEGLLASLRVSDPVKHLIWAGDHLVAAGVHGPYVFRLVDGHAPSRNEA